MYGAKWEVATGTPTRLGSSIYRSIRRGTCTCITGSVDIGIARVGERGLFRSWNNTNAVGLGVGERGTGVYSALWGVANNQSSVLTCRGSVDAA
jgi:hypothetical protein